jgi:hypothetical protein
VTPDEGRTGHFGITHHKWRLRWAGSLANHSGGHNWEGSLMSMQPPAAPHRVAIADIQIPFWRMVAIIIKWTLASIPAAIVLSLIFGIILAAIAFGLAMLGVNVPTVKL